MPLSDLARKSNPDAHGFTEALGLQAGERVVCGAARLPGVFHGRAAGGAPRQSGQAGSGAQDRRFGRAVNPCLEVLSGSSGAGNVESIEKCADSQVPADEECDVNQPLPAKGMLGSLVQGCIDGVL